MIVPIIINNALEPVSIVEQVLLPLDNGALNADIGLSTYSTTESTVIGLNPPREAILSEIEAVFGRELAPAAYQLALCESSLRQFKDGEILMSDTGDAGIFQIHLSTWLEKSREMGLNILDSWTDNVKMAHFILYTQGWKSWTCFRSL